jgi:hypothetical protein
MASRIRAFARRIRFAGLTWHPFYESVIGILGLSPSRVENAIKRLLRQVRNLRAVYADSAHPVGQITEPMLAIYLSAR